MTALQTFLRCAEESVGGRYCTPPNEPHCTDCSGLVARCMHRATGRVFTGDSHVQMNLGRMVSGALQPGDLLFFDAAGGREVREGNRASHVAIYVGNGQIINALNERAGIVRGPLDTDYWRPLRIGSRRYFADAGSLIVQLGGSAPEPPIGIAEPVDPSTTPPARPPRRGHERERSRDRRRVWQRAFDKVRRRRVQR